MDPPWTAIWGRVGPGVRSEVDAARSTAAAIAFFALQHYTAKPGRSCGSALAGRREKSGLAIGTPAGLPGSFQRDRPSPRLTPGSSPPSRGDVAVSPGAAIGVGCPPSRPTHYFIAGSSRSRRLFYAASVTAKRVRGTGILLKKREEPIQRSADQRRTSLPSLRARSAASHPAATPRRCRSTGCLAPEPLSPGLPARQQC